MKAGCAVLHVDRHLSPEAALGGDRRRFILSIRVQGYQYRASEGGKGENETTTFVVASFRYAPARPPLGLPSHAAGVEACQ